MLQMLVVRFTFLLCSVLLCYGFLCFVVGWLDLKPWLIEAIPQTAFAQSDSDHKQSTEAIDFVMPDAFKFQINFHWNWY